MLEVAEVEAKLACSEIYFMMAEAKVELSVTSSAADLANSFLILLFFLNFFGLLSEISSELSFAARAEAASDFWAASKRSSNCDTTS